ncbi:NADH dehydrogenase [ubiquinone] 1 alpha subcomplex assembly factor 4 [Ambystoma mexicanum]|uniref:NADH dehydrogenase [ubiquinone] 1 alpha subcomplex assembly factor 4 n=1 Tax=Ambystoma mexicanum TaxID=8296 RepID=UPI0037E78B33
MGGLVTRAFKNFNVESRAHRVISKEKPNPAPLHPTTQKDIELLNHHRDLQDKIYKKDDNLLSLLREVYVHSTDPLPAQASESSAIGRPQEEFRHPKLSFKQDPSSILNVENIPRGKLSIVEALAALSNHKNHPDMWTAEKIAEEYCLELKDTKSLLEFFIPFDVRIVPPTEPKQIKDT